MNSELLKSHALQGLHDGKITQAEYDAYIQSLDSKKTTEKTLDAAIAENSKLQNNQARKSSNKKLIVAILLLVFLIDVIWIMTNTSNISGNAIIDLAKGNHSENFTLHSDDKLSSIRVTGTLFGEGEAIISYNTSTGLLHVATIRSDDGSPRTAKPSYSPDETITIQNEPSSYTAYLDDGQNNVAITLPLQAPQSNATLLIVANNSGELATYRLPIIIGDASRKTFFADLCDQTCDITPQTGDLIVETTGDATIEFEKIAATTEENNAPQYAIQIGTITTDGPETKQIDLNMHFADPDNDQLYYSTSNSNIANLTINGNNLTITPINNGEETITIYASDLKEIVSGTFTLNASGITQEAPQNSTIINDTISNITSNDTAPVNNQTAENTTASNQSNATETIINNSIGCNNPDPNERPIECLLNSTTNYFAEQDIYWHDSNREPIARFSTVGNLLIKGDIIEYSTQQPDKKIFYLGYANDDLDIVPTIWADEQGNIHLKGALHEEQGQIVPPPNSYSFNNRKGITLAYADLRSGELHLRGNVIPFRKSVTS